MPDPSSLDAVVTIVKIGFVVIPLLMVFAIIRAMIYGGRRRKILRGQGQDPRRLNCLAGGKG